MHSIGDGDQRSIRIRITIVNEALAEVVVRSSILGMRDVKKHVRSKM